MNSLDREISDAFGLLGVLLVFAFAYASALVPVVLTALEQPTPTIQDDRRVFIARLRAYHHLTIALVAVGFGVGVVLAPLSRRVITAWSFSGPFRTTRAGLLLIDILLCLTIGASIALEPNLATQIRDRQKLPD